LIVLETERLTLRQIVADDAAFVIELLNEPAYIANIVDQGVRTSDDARQYIANRLTASYERNGFGLFGVELRDSAELIGMCGLIKRDSLEDVDIGYAFLQRFWGRGYAVESAEATLAYGRDVLGLKRIVAITSPDNDASARLLQKIGLHHEKTFALAGYEGDTVLFGIEFD
jgi:RimJ/RimL family protein N-acetyltransferase